MRGSPKKNESRKFLPGKMAQDLSRLPFISGQGDTLELFGEKSEPDIPEPEKLREFLNDELAEVEVAHPLYSWLQQLFDLYVQHPEYVQVLETVVGDYKSDFLKVTEVIEHLPPVPISFMTFGYRVSESTTVIADPLLVQIKLNFDPLDRVIILIPAGAKLGYVLEGSFVIPAVGSLRYIGSQLYKYHVPPFLAFGAEAIDGEKEFPFYQYDPTPIEYVAQLQNPDLQRKPDWKELMQMQLEDEKGRDFSVNELQEKLKPYMSQEQINNYYLKSIEAGTLRPIEAYTKCCALLGVIGYLGHLYIPAANALYWAVTQYTLMFPSPKMPELVIYYLDRLHTGLPTQNVLEHTLRHDVYSSSAKLIRAFTGMPQMEFQPNAHANREDFMALLKELNYIIDLEVQNITGAGNVYCLELARYLDAKNLPADTCCFAELAILVPNLWARTKHLLPSIAQSRMIGEENPQLLQQFQTVQKRYQQLQ